MIDHPDPLKMLLKAILIVFVLTEGLCRQPKSKCITLENEEIVYVSVIRGDHLGVKCDNSRSLQTIDFEWEFQTKKEWYQNSESKMLDRTQRLSLVNVSSDNAGQYFCTIKYGFDENVTTSEKRAFFLNVIQIDHDVSMDLGLTFYTYVTEDVALLVNRTLHLNCPFMSTHDTVFSWHKNDTLLVEKKAFIGDLGYLDHVYSLKNVKLSDAGNYTCKVQCNNCSISQIQRTFIVNIHEDGHQMNETLEYPQDLSLNRGDTARFYCRCAQYSFFDLKWFYLNHTNPTDIDIETVELSHFKNVKSKNDKDKFEFVIDNVEMYDAGWYICVAMGNQTIFLICGAKLDVGTTLSNSLGDDKHNELNNSFENISLQRFLSLILAMLVTLVLLVFCILVLLVCSVRQLSNHNATRRKTKKTTTEELEMTETTQLSTVNIDSKEIENTNQDHVSMMEFYDIVVDPRWEFSRDNLSIGTCIGEGVFSKVFRGEAIGILRKNVVTTVAIKMLKDGHTDFEFFDFESEIEIMKKIGKHVNIINLFGCCTRNGPLYMLLEFALHGNLRDFLRRHKQTSGNEQGIESNVGNFLTQQDLLSFASQVAKGMGYLVSKMCIHRDLAARNILVCGNFVMKISNFGLARDIQNLDYYRQTTDGRFPVKWMAPEALFHRINTHQSDVWSYGVLLWEIMSFGGIPYASVHNLNQLLNLIKSGERLEKPSNCSAKIYKVMRKCWRYRPNERPTFVVLMNCLDPKLSIEEDQPYLELRVPRMDTPSTSQD